MIDLHGRVRLTEVHISFCPVCSQVGVETYYMHILYDSLHDGEGPHFVPWCR